MQTEQEVFDLIDQAMLSDQRRLRARLRALRRRGEDPSAAARLAEEITASVTRRRKRMEDRPRIEYPDDLPICFHRDKIVQALQAHQVIVVCGETGSGKTTQLPKICLELGRGVGGLIGHTQPRRIAARSVAMRLAEELGTHVGGAVGYKVRFGDHASRDGYIKLMTDGILLAETQHDPLLLAYDTLIIDEAHERSLNIDFLLGYLKRLLPRRPDLKLIITSATINPQQFSRHFGDAPVIEVSGRTYPVEVRYRPLEDLDGEPIELSDAILAAVDELGREAPGDVLVFLSGEREIREAAEALRKHHPPQTEILPLYARLSAEEQMRVFKPHPHRRIVLATNVAETSLTVPGIKYVVDPGYARISRYTTRTKVQRLPIEPISQASALQRAGRCGRVSEGICIRLYSQEDFAQRPAYTEPEILRTNLASVILQMKALKLGEVQEFPFLDPPDYRQIRDGYATLHEIGAIDEHNELTSIGWKLARLPVDPRIGRMILAGAQEHALSELLVIAAALSIQDPRERPLDKAQLADEAHGQWKDDASDFLTILKLWNHYHEQASHLSRRKLRAWCHEQFLSVNRMREWVDVHSQLKELVGELQLHINDRPAKPDCIHRALLSGLLGHVGLKTDTHEYTGAHSKKFMIFPGSGLFKSKPRWVMAAELVETTRLYARTVAAIEPQWIERLAGHLVKRDYTDPHWDDRSGHVRGFEKVTLFGLPIVPRRSIHYGPIDPVVSRGIFIQHALVQGEMRSSAPFFLHNVQLLAHVRLLEAKARRRDLRVDQQQLFAFFDARIPPGIHNVPLFEKWRRQAELKDPHLLFLRPEEVMRPEAATITLDRYPDQIVLDDLRLALTYNFEPGDREDGITVTIPLPALNQVPAHRFEWLVPGHLLEKVELLIRSLPRQLRTVFVPIPDTAAAAVREMPFAAGSLLDALAGYLSSWGKVMVRRYDFDPDSLPDHLRMNFRVVDAQGKVLASGRDLAEIREKLGVQVKEAFQELPQSPFHRRRVTRWDFGDLPDRVPIERHGMTVWGYPALVDHGENVSIDLLDSPDVARQAMRKGITRLFAIELRKEIEYLSRHIPNFDQLALWYKPVDDPERLRHDIMTVVADRALMPDGHDIRTQQDFAALAESGWRRLTRAGDEVFPLVERILSQYHAVAVGLSRAFPPLLQPSVAEMRAHLSSLIYPGFLIHTPYDWLIHLPRFLRGIEVRLTKLQSAGLERDRRASAQLQPLQEQYDQRLLLHSKRDLHDPEMARYFWMLQELAVSLFAQELKTSIPVSPERLARQWARTRAE